MSDHVLAESATEVARRLAHRYADAVCHRDEQRWAATWDDDAEWNLRGTVIKGKPAIVELWLSAMGGFEQVIQNVLNGEAQFDGDTGSGRCYIVEHFRRANGAVGMLLAYYDDTFRRTGDEWRFASRSLVVLYGGPPDLSAPFSAAPTQSPA